MEKLIWMPKLRGKFDLDIYLDVGFAKELLESKCDEKTQENMNRLGRELLNRFDFKWDEPYSFYKDTPFVNKFNISYGTDLLLPRTDLEGMLKSNQNILEYSSHEVFTHKEAYVLMALFNQWVEYSEVLKILE
jgi:hypothetical protein